VKQDLVCQLVIFNPKKLSILITELAFVKVLSNQDKEFIMRYIDG
jgi:hypothetical protein